MNVIADNIPSHIRSKLERLADSHNVKILLAIESGSRAWGFPSTDSDYDVRFVYMHSANDYLGIEDQRDVIETPTLPDPELGTVMDMNGWDLKKTLHLALKSNAVIHEWITSPIRYMENKSMLDPLISFITATADLAAYAYHYDRLARNTYARIAENPEEARLKHYCYVLRPILSLQWIDRFQSPPPMDMPSLRKGLKLDQDIEAAITDLIARKSTASETDTTNRNALLDRMIEDALVAERSKPVDKPRMEDRIKKANDLFRTFVLPAMT